MIYGRSYMFYHLKLAFLLLTLIPHDKWTVCVAAKRRLVKTSTASPSLMPNTRFWWRLIASFNNFFLSPKMRIYSSNKHAINVYCSRMWLSQRFFTEAKAFIVTKSRPNNLLFYTSWSAIMKPAIKMILLNQWMILNQQATSLHLRLNAVGAAGFTLASAGSASGPLAAAGCCLALTAVAVVSPAHFFLYFAAGGSASPI